MKSHKYTMAIKNVRDMSSVKISVIDKLYCKSGDMFCSLCNDLFYSFNTTRRQLYSQ